MGGSVGRFHPGSSPLHELDPRAKLVAAAILAGGMFFVGSLIGMLAVAAFVAAAAGASRVPAAVFLRLLVPVAFIVAFAAVFQVAFSREGPVLLEWGVLEVHAGGVRLGFLLSARIVLLVTAAGIVTATTSPVSLSDGIESLLSPLKRVRLPAHELAMMMTIALRFIPTLQEEARKVVNAQAARGADFSEGGPVRRARAFLPVLILLTVGAFRRADDLAEAMESRGYRGGEGRTRYRELRLRPRDALAVLLTALVAAIGVSP